MRNFTKCFAALALTMCMGGQATAQVYKPVKRATTLEAGKEYFLYNTTRVVTSNENRSWFLYDNAGSLAVDQSADPSVMRILSADKAKYAYTLEAVDGGEQEQWAIKSASGYVGIGGATNNTEIGTNQTFVIEKYAESGKKSGSDAGSYPDLLAGEAAGDYTSMSNTWAIYAPGVTGYNCFNGNPGSFAKWSTAHPYAFYEIGEVAATVVYQYKDDLGNTIAASEVVDLESTDGYTVPAGKTIDGFTYIEADKNAVEAGTVTTVTYTYKLDKLPFVTSDVTGTEWTGEEHWYTLNQYNNDPYITNNTYWVYDEASNSVNLTATSLDVPLADAALWCITGNITDGFKFYNKAVGPEQSIYVGDTDKSNALFQTNGATFKLYYQMVDGQPSKLGFFKVGDTENVFLNVRDNKLSTWVNASAKGDNGSIVNFVEPDVIELAYYTSLRTNIEEGLGCVTGYSQADYDASNMAAATTADEFKTAYAQLKGKGIAVNPNGYYRLTCNVRNYTIGISGTNAVGQTLDRTSVDQLWQLEAVDGVENSYRLYSPNHKQYFSPVANNAVTLTDKDNAGTYTMSEIVPGFVNLAISGNLLHGAQGGALITWNSQGLQTASAWKIVPAEDIDVTLNAVEGKSYATVHLPFATTTGDVKAYYATANDGTNVTMTETTDGIAANQGALLVSESGAATATLTIADDVTAPTGNLLKGTNVTTTITDANDYYIFGNGDAGVGFYHPSATTLKANRAYIEAGTAAAASLKLSFGQTTGIGSIVNPAADAAAAPLYDLQGRRVNSATKGIYIQGGKKVYVK